LLSRFNRNATTASRRLGLSPIIEISQSGPMDPMILREPWALPPGLVYWMRQSSRTAMSNQFIHQDRRAQGMAIAHPTETPIIDPATGQLRPLSAEERRARSQSLRRTLAEIDTITDETDTDEVWAEVYRGLTAARPECPPANGNS
jgi:hypothetical protein